MKPLIKSCAGALLSLLLSACVIPLPVIGGGIAGAGRDSTKVQNTAYHYPTFQDSQVEIEVIPAAANFSHERTYSRDQYFTDFTEHSRLVMGQETRMGNFQLRFSNRKNELRLQMRDAENQLIDESIPRAFYMGDMQVGRFQIRQNSYLIFAANSRTSTGKAWFGIFDEAGKKYYAASLPQVSTLVNADASGIHILQKNAPSFKIHLP